MNSQFYFITFITHHLSFITYHSWLIPYLYNGNMITFAAKFDNVVISRKTEVRSQKMGDGSGEMKDRRPYSPLEKRCIERSRNMGRGIDKDKL